MSCKKCEMDRNMDEKATMLWPLLSTFAPSHPLSLNTTRLTVYTLAFMPQQLGHLARLSPFYGLDFSYGLPDGEAGMSHDRCGGRV